MGQAKYTLNLDSNSLETIVSKRALPLLKIESEKGETYIALGYKHSKSDYCHFSELKGNIESINDGEIKKIFDNIYKIMMSDESISSLKYFSRNEFNISVQDPVLIGKFNDLERRLVLEKLSKISAWSTNEFYEFVRDNQDKYDLILSYCVSTRGDYFLEDYHQQLINYAKNENLKLDKLRDLKSSTKFKEILDIVNDAGIDSKTLKLEIEKVQKQKTKRRFNVKLLQQLFEHYGEWPFKVKSKDIDLGYFSGIRQMSRNLQARNKGYPENCFTYALQESYDSLDERIQLIQGKEYIKPPKYRDISEDYDDSFLDGIEEDEEVIQDMPPEREDTKLAEESEVFPNDLGYDESIIYSREPHEPHFEDEDDHLLDREGSFSDGEDNVYAIENILGLETEFPQENECYQDSFDFIETLADEHEIIPAGDEYFESIVLGEEPFIEDEFESVLESDFTPEFEDLSEEETGFIQDNKYYMMSFESDETQLVDEREIIPNDKEYLESIDCGDEPSIEDEPVYISESELQKLYDPKFFEKQDADLDFTGEDVI